jgi:disulfide bond formation protein DsbB
MKAMKMGEGYAPCKICTYSKTFVVVTMCVIHCIVAHIFNDTTIKALGYAMHILFHAKGFVSELVYLEKNNIQYLHVSKTIFHKTHNIKTRYNKYNKTL